ncbi:MAG: NERD domain-containing protein [Dehalococcoidales bacterium]|nr:NERD domain-containing protein [Dehalococcoidales bacterium]
MGLQALVKGWTGELRTKLAEGLFLDHKIYHVFNNLLLKTGFGTTQIDHVVVSKYGIFVIETKNKDGYIYGKPYDVNWTQVFYKKKFIFQNPLRQNYLHTRSLAEFLNLDERNIHSVVVFWGTCKFRTTMPPNVLINNLTGYIHNKKQVLLSNEAVIQICEIIQKIKDNTSFLDGWRHSRELSKRFER